MALLLTCNWCRVLMLWQSNLFQATSCLSLQLVMRTCCSSAVLRVLGRSRGPPDFQGAGKYVGQPFRKYSAWPAMHHLQVRVVSWSHFWEYKSGGNENSISSVQVNRININFDINMDSISKVYGKNQDEIKVPINPFHPFIPFYQPAYGFVYKFLTVTNGKIISFFPSLQYQAVNFPYLASGDLRYPISDLTRFSVRLIQSLDPEFQLEPQRSKPQYVFKSFERFRVVLLIGKSLDFLPEDLLSANEDSRNSTVS